MSNRGLPHAFGLRGIRDASTPYRYDAVILRAGMIEALIQRPIPATHQISPISFLKASSFR